MRIAFDAKRIFNNRTGLGNYARTLLDNLYRFYPENDYILYTPNIQKNPDLQKYAQQFNTITAQTRFKHIWRSYSIRKDLEKENIAIYHGLSNEIPFWLKNTKTIVTIHDVIFKTLPHTYPTLDRWLYEEKTRYAVKYADIIITISEHTKKDLIKFYNADAHRIKVIYPACNPIYYQEKSKGDEVCPPNLSTFPNEYMLYVGSIIERKNLLNIIKAIELLPKSLQIPLVVVGKGKIYQKKVKAYIQAKNLENLVFWITNLDSNQSLKYIYQKAQFMIFPSTYEGFGLPVVEALLSETPVITSNQSSLPEAGGSSAICVNPYNIDALKTAIQSMLENTDLNLLAKKGRIEALKRFDPHYLTQQVIEAYKNIF